MSNNWHIYPEEKPDNDNAVLVKIKYDNIIHKAMYYNDNSTWYVLEDEEISYEEYSYERYDLDDITHWIELPDLPKELEV